MKKYFFSLILSLLALSLPIPTQALTASPSATPSEAVDPQTQKNIQDRLKDLVQENLASTEASLKERIDQQSFVGYVGHITEISSGIISIKTKNDLLRTATDDKTVIVNKGQNVKITSLAIGEKIILIGTTLKKDIVQARRIVVVIDEPDEVTTEVILGTITTVDAKKKTVTISTNNIETTYTLAKKTPHKITDFIPGQKVITIVKFVDDIKAIYKSKAI